MDVGLNLGAGGGDLKTVCLSLQVWLELLKPLAKQIKCKSRGASLHSS